jgi:hypothetical protein
MPTFRCEFNVTGDLVLPTTIDQLEFSGSDGFRFTIKNVQPDSDGHAPALLIFVVGFADSLDTAHLQLREALAAQLDLLSFATHSRFKIASPIKLVEWEEWQETRYIDWFHETDSRYPPDPELAAEYLESITVLDQMNPPAFLRKALRYFRYGLIDPDSEDQFTRFWLALEIMAENTKSKQKVPITCPACNTALKCDVCGVEPTRVPMAKQALKIPLENLRHRKYPNSFLRLEMV